MAAFSIFLQPIEPFLHINFLIIIFTVNCIRIYIRFTVNVLELHPRFFPYFFKVCFA